MKDYKEIDCMDLIRHQRDAERIFELVGYFYNENSTIKGLSEDLHNEITEEFSIDIDSDWLENIVENWIDMADKAEVIYDLICLLKSEFECRSKVNFGNVYHPCGIMGGIPTGLNEKPTILTEGEEILPIPEHKINQTKINFGGVEFTVGGVCSGDGGINLSKEIPVRLSEGEEFLYTDDTFELPKHRADDINKDFGEE